MHRRLYIWVYFHVLDFPRSFASGNWKDAIFDGSPQFPNTLVRSSCLPHSPGAHCPRTMYEIWTWHQSIVAFYN
jgi:hypothetical protein